MPAPIPDLTRDQTCHHYQAPSGQRCGSPAMKGEYYCYHHLVKNNYKKNHRVLIDPEVTRMELPPIEDRASIFIALAAVVHRLAENTIDTRRAGQMIYALQVAMRALEPPRGQRFQTSPAAQSHTEPHPAAQSHSEAVTESNSEAVTEHLSSRSVAEGSASSCTSQPATSNLQPATPRTIPITKESLLYFLRSRHCYNCNAELFPAEELTERPNPGAPPEIIEEAHQALPAPEPPPVILPAPEAVILSEGRSPQSKDPVTVHPATVDHTFPAQPHTRCSAETSGPDPAHSAGTLPTLHASVPCRRRAIKEREKEKRSTKCLVQLAVSSNPLMTARLS